jgi:hypothetical protein
MQNQKWFLGEIPVRHDYDGCSCDGKKRIGQVVNARLKQSFHP